MSRYAYLAIASTLLALPIAAPAEDRALLIGISDYTGDASPLIGPANDLRLVSDLAQNKLGFAANQIKVLSDADATRTGVIGAFENWLIAGTEPGDQIFIYYSGHGTQVLDEPGGDEGPEGMDEALVMVDFRYETAADSVLTDDEIGAFLAKLSDRDLTMVVDACHSGTVSRALAEGSSEPIAQARFVPPRSKPFAAQKETPLSREMAGGILRRDTGLAETDPVAPGRKYEIWSSAAPYQLAWETPIQGTSHGVFTWHFVNALTYDLADLNGNGRTSREELLSHIAQEAEVFCLSHPGCRAQGFTPQLETQASSRFLQVLEWLDGSNASKEHSVDEMLDLLTGGRRDISLEMVHLKPQMSRPLRAGDDVAFEITSEKDGEVLLFDLRDGGVVHQLFPSAAFAKNTPIVTNKTLRIPDAYTRVNFAIPPGAGTLVALVVHDQGLVAELSQRNTDLKPIRDPAQFFGELMSMINGNFHDAPENRKVEFGIATLRYKL